MAIETITIDHCGESVTMTWDGAEQSAPIEADGVPIGRTTADARHRKSEAVRLVCAHTWGPVYETRDHATADGRDAAAAITIWDDVSYD